MKTLKTALLAVVLLLVLSSGLIWMGFQWHLCRSEGFGFWYCVQHIA